MITPDFSMTTLEAAQANTRAANQLQVDTVNASRIAEYEEQWKKYVQSRDERPEATNLIVPMPARAEAVFTADSGWPFIDASDKPVIAPHTYVPQATTPKGWFTAGTMTIGTSAPDPFAVALYATVEHDGMKFVRVA